MKFKLEKVCDEMKRIGDISWGYDGDCGAQAIVDSVIDKNQHHRS